ncbi:uncharacterized protein LAESUDRAFT_276390 [Laetiporus sulphureus 93-53]|uniref:Uncharacterized protein n=1 Tax=Laetiporus sulphureus 93-53 TaxID=1314785 RepID=A0A165HD08_9APHY|nr:uncharacterized protein LAESUDRAFT_276390 [Laetiporus sulphureus 93-53]KZT11570.1 hypothetical protein LAESUDRAFT_276390 [Laetiporus sulphureus 93-53]
MMDSDPQDLQVHLSEYLQILDHYQYHEERMPYSDLSRLNKRGRDRNIDIELELLDSIALCLATGQSHDVVATIFDKRHAITILLSKNHAPSVTDREQASLFFNALSDPKNTRAINIITVIATYAWMNLNKRVKKVAESLGDVRLRIEALMDGYKAGPRESEFHSSDPILSLELDVRQSLELVINVLSDKVTDFDINSGDRMDTLRGRKAHSSSLICGVSTTTCQAWAILPGHPTPFSIPQPPVWTDTPVSMGRFPAP